MAATLNAVRRAGRGEAGVAPRAAGAHCAMAGCGAAAMGEPDRARARPAAGGEPR